MEYLSDERSLLLEVLRGGGGLLGSLQLCAKGTGGLLPFSQPRLQWVQLIIKGFLLPIYVVRYC